MYVLYMYVCMYVCVYIYIYILLGRGLQRAEPGQLGEPAAEAGRRGRRHEGAGGIIVMIIIIYIYIYIYI